MGIHVVNSNGVLLLEDTTPQVELFKYESLWFVIFSGQSFNGEPNFIKNFIQNILKGLSCFQYSLLLEVLLIFRWLGMGNAILAMHGVVDRGRGEGVVYLSHSQMNYTVVASWCASLSAHC